MLASLAVGLLILAFPSTGAAWGSKDFTCQNGTTVPGGLDAGPKCAGCISSSGNNNSEEMKDCFKCCDELVYCTGQSGCKANCLAKSNGISSRASGTFNSTSDLGSFLRERGLLTPTLEEGLKEIDGSSRKTKGCADAAPQDSDTPQSDTAAAKP
jgi:hypothetical protein